MKVVVGPGTSPNVSQLLSERSGLSKSRVKDAMNKGAVWVRMKKGGLRRLRRATATLREGDCLEFHYDEKVLSLEPAEAVCLSDQRHYSVWYKSAGTLAQGTKYGDHRSLLRAAELHFRCSREVYLVHRLDREASGLMLVAHSSRAAASLSELIRENRIEKMYQAEVLGRPGDEGMRKTIDLPLDGKPSVTEFQVESYNSDTGTTKVSVVIATGRLHQIRRHFALTGHPVIGDPKYGKGNKNSEGMKLEAVSLKFRCPFLKSDVFYKTSPAFKVPEKSSCEINKGSTIIRK